MTTPKLLDLFCGAGGCSVGYSRAGFDCYGIDNDPKPLRHYPFPWVCMDALEAMGIDWMTKQELTQAIPPAYTEYIGKYLLQAVKNE